MVAGPDGFAGRRVVTRPHRFAGRCMVAGPDGLAGRSCVSWECNGLCGMGVFGRHPIERRRIQVAFVDPFAAGFRDEIEGAVGATY